MNPRMRVPYASAKLVGPSSVVSWLLPLGLFGKLGLERRSAGVEPAALSQNSRRIVPVPPVPWGMKLATTLVLATTFIVMGLVRPWSGPVQPAKSKPEAGVAVRVTGVPPAYVAATGLTVTVPEPFVVVVSVNWRFGLPTPEPARTALRAAWSVIAAVLRSNRAKPLVWLGSTPLSQ